jgi:hypothetical protein
MLKIGKPGKYIRNFLTFLKYGARKGDQLDNSRDKRLEEISWTIRVRKGWRRSARQFA